MDTFIPLFNSVVVEPIPQPERYAGLIVIPESARKTGKTSEAGGTVGKYTDQGIVTAVGEGYKYGLKFVPDYAGAKGGDWKHAPVAQRRPLEVQVGDVVLFEHMGGPDLVFDGQKRIISERHIIAVLEP